MAGTSLIETILAEGPIGTQAAANLLGTFRDGKPCHHSTVSRWIKQGCTLPDGTILKLEAVRIAGRLMTSRPALVRFVAAQQDSSEPQVTKPKQASAKACAAAGATLEALGA